MRPMRQAHEVAVLRCLSCDKIDPLNEPQLESWIKSNALKPSRKQDK